MSQNITALVERTVGALFVGTILASVLYGVTCVQSYIYWCKYPKDPWYIKALVLVTWVTDTTHQILITQALYVWLILNFANVPELNHIIPTNTTELYFNGTTGLLVKCFFAFRIWHVSGRNIFLVGLIVASVLAEFVVTITFASIALRASTWAQLVPHKTLSSMIFVLAAFSDILIATVLCVVFYRTRSEVTKNSRSMLNKLMLYSLNTGLLTSFAAIACLVTLLALPAGSLTYIALYHVMGRLYINSLLATLNARDGMRTSMEVRYPRLPTSVLDRSLSTMNRMYEQGSGLAVFVETSTTRDVRYNSRRPSIVPESRRDNDHDSYSLAETGSPRSCLKSSIRDLDTSSLDRDSERHGDGAVEVASPGAHPTSGPGIAV